MLAKALFNYAVEKLEVTYLAPISRCKVCGGDAHPFDIVDLYKCCNPSLYPFGLSGIPVMYKLCQQCRFIFTDFFDQFTSDQWQAHIYNDDYIKVDLEYVTVRPRQNARQLVSLLVGKREEIVGLDYGGGNGLTAAIMRGNGWMFDSFDPFGHTDVHPDREGKYNFCSAFEVFEHSPDPVGSLRAIIEKASSERLIVLIGTTIHDSFITSETRLSWWYAAPRNGHVSLYSRRSLEILAAEFGLTYTSFQATTGTHLLTRGLTKGEASTVLLRGKALWKCRSTLKMWSGSLA